MDFKKISVLTLSCIAVFSLTSTVMAANTDKVSLVTYTQLQSQVNLGLAKIKNRDDLTRVSSTSSPLDYLSSGAKADFIESVTFNNLGVTGFNTYYLESELTLSQIYEILALLGFQSGTYQFTNAQVKTATDALILSQGINLKSEESASDAQFYSSPLPRMSDFLKGYRCESRGTCVDDPGAACTTNC